METYLDMARTDKADSRIWGEKAEFSEMGGESNIPHLLKAAYRDLAMTKIRNLL